MTLVVEDGTALANAESYASVAYADTYHSNRGNAAWAALATPDKEVALRLSTEFMLQQFRPLWKGWRRTFTQRLDWPRIGVEVKDVGGTYARAYGTLPYIVPPTVIPEEVQNACCELALRQAASGALAPDMERRMNTFKAGPVQIEFDRGSPDFTVYRSVNAMLAIYIQPQSTSGMVRLGRS